LEKLYWSHQNYKYNHCQTFGFQLRELLGTCCFCSLPNSFEIPPKLVCVPENQIALMVQTPCQIDTIESQTFFNAELHNASYTSKAF
jgi:hypothetical protein